MMSKVIMILLSCQLVAGFSSPDPKATQILKRVEDRILSAGSMKANFNLEISEAEKKPYSQKGTFSFKKNKFQLILPGTEVFCNGKDHFTYMKDRKEVQIVPQDEADQTYHPRYLAGLYKTGKYDYRLEKEMPDAYWIEFKPLDKKAEYFKVKMKLDKKIPSIREVLIYYKNGDKHLIQFLNVVWDIQISDSDFELNINKLDNVHVEDLR